MHTHSIILEEASLELVPKRFWNHESCKIVEARFGLPPQSQILDDNFHHKIIVDMSENEKRGRPDIVHFALLDIVSTPAYLRGLIRPIIRTVNGDVILIKENVRLPRTELRFNGVMSKILRKETSLSEARLFDFKEGQTIGELVESLNLSKVSCLSTEGIEKDLSDLVATLTKETSDDSIGWIVGGFARGHFSEEVKKLADDLISISNYALASHVVTARLAYEIERYQKRLHEDLP
jgi:rRNA small subunit pseudouridine methyltransferase Nep1